MTEQRSAARTQERRFRTARSTDATIINNQINIATHDAFCQQPLIAVLITATKHQIIQLILSSIRLHVRNPQQNSLATIYGTDLFLKPSQGSLDQTASLGTDGNLCLLSTSS